MTEQKSEALLKQYERLIYQLAQRCAHPPVADIEDLAQIGRLVLLQCAAKHDPSRTKFITMAQHWIYGYMRRHVSDMKTTIRIPSACQNKTGRTSHLYVDPTQYHPVSLNSRNRVERSLYDYIPDPAQDENDKLQQMELYRALNALDVRTRQVIIRHRLYGDTLQDIADDMGTSKERARQLEIKGLKLLRSLLSE